MAASTGIRVTASSLWELATLTRSSADQQQSETARLSGTLLGRVGSDWSGLASSQFQQLWNEWHQAAQKVQVALDGISTLLKQAGDAYESAEQSIASSFRAV